MLKTMRALINALNEKKLVESIKLLDSGETKYPKMLERNSYEMMSIDNLGNSIRKDNLKKYAGEMVKVTAKRSTFLAPIILLGLTVFSFKTDKYTKTINVENVYESSVLEFDEESILSEDNITYAQTGLTKQYVDESIISLNEFDNISTLSDAIIYYGEGSKSLQAKFNINNDHTWSYASHTNNLYEKSQVDTPKGIREVDEEYLRLLNEVTETFIKQAQLSEEEIDYVRNLISDNENNILIKIRRCVKTGERELDIYTSHWFRDIIAIIATITVLGVIIKNISFLTDVNSLEVGSDYRSDTLFEDCRLRLNGGYRESLSRLLSITKEYRDTYLLAESNRIKNILEILKTCNAEHKIIEEYSKRLKVTTPQKRLELK